jgi:hypothetical protein
VTLSSYDFCKFESRWTPCTAFRHNLNHGNGYTGWDATSILVVTHVYIYTMMTVTSKCSDWHQIWHVHRLHKDRTFCQIWCHLVKLCLHTGAFFIFIILNIKIIDSDKSITWLYKFESRWTPCTAFRHNLNHGNWCTGWDATSILLVVRICIYSDDCNFKVLRLTPNLECA